MAGDLEFFSDVLGEPDTLAPTEQAIRDQMLTRQKMRESSTQFTETPSGYQPLVPEMETSFFQDVGNGFSNLGIGIVPGAADAAINKVMDVANSEVDPDYDLGGHLETDPKLGATVQGIVDAANNDDYAAQAIYNALKDTRNPEWTAKLIKRWQDTQRTRKELEKAGYAGLIVGGVGALSVDVAAAILGGGGAMAGGAATRITSMLSAKNPLTQRLLAAGRVGVEGAAITGLEAEVNSLSDLDISENDVLMASGLGFVAGGALGAIAPKFLGRIATREQLAKMEIDLAKMDALRKSSIELSGDSVGAARAQAGEFGGVDLVTPAKGSDTLLTSRKFFPDALRNPKNVVASMFVRGSKEKVEHGLTGNLRFGSFMQRVWKSARLNENELEGEVGRTMALTEVLNEIQADLFITGTKTRDTYKAMLADAFDVGNVRASATNTQPFELPVLSKVGSMLRGGAPSLEEFNHAADIYGIARESGFLAGNEERILAVFKRELSPEQKSKLLSALEKQATIDDQFYAQSFDKAVAVGMFDEADRVQGYRPQNWNTKRIMSDEAKFKNWLYEVIGGEPDVDWVNAHFQEPVEAVAAEGAAAAPKPLLREGERWADFAKREPEMAREVALEWEDSVAAGRADRLRDLEEALREELGRVGYKTVEDAKIRRRNKIAQHDRALTELEADLHKVDGTEGFVSRQDRDDILRMITKRETEKQGVMNALSDLMKLDNEAAVLRAAVRNATKEQRTELRAFRKAVARTERKVAALAAKKTLAEAVDEITQKIKSADQFMGYVPDDLTRSSKHFKFRSIRLGKHILDEEAGHFMVRDSDHVRTLYADTFNRQVAIRETLGPIVKATGRETDKDFLSNLRRIAVEEPFDRDLSKVEKSKLGPKVRQRILQDKLKAGEIFDRAFGEITRSDYLGQTSSADSAIRSAQALTAASALGMVLLSLFSDVALTAFAGGRTGTGFRRLFVSNRGLLEKIAQDDISMAMLIRGENVMDQGAYLARADIDFEELDFAGSKWRTINRTTNNIAKLSGWANMMHVWNRFIRGSFGVDMARQIGDDLVKFDALPRSMKQFYARHGVGKKEAAELAHLLSTKGRSYLDGKITMPDTAAWSEAGAHTALRRYYRLMREAGNEALIDPNMGDRPFWRRSMIGRLIMQFQSFMYTAAERWYAPLWQAGVLNPKETRVWVSATLALMMAMAGNAAREHIAGRGDEYWNKWSTGQGTFDNMKAAWLRSPYVFGMTGLLGDYVGTQFAPAVNNAFASATGSNFKPFNEKNVRLRQQQGTLALFGAAPGVVGSYGAMIRELAEGDTEKAAELAKYRVPVYNTLPFLLGGKLINYIGEE